MNAIVNFFNSFASFIKNSATEVTKTFTGADSGAVFVMIIFYLILLIVFIVLLKVLVKVIKVFLKDFCSKKAKHSKPSEENNSSTVPNKNIVINDSIESEQNVVKSTEQQLFDEFDGQKYLTLLKEKYNIIKDKDSDVIFREAQHIVSPPPKLLAVDGSKKKIILSDAEKKVILSKTKSDHLVELQQLLKTLSEETVVMNDKIYTLNNSLTDSCKSREKFVENELLALEKHNTYVDELKVLINEFNSTKTSLAVGYSQLFNLVSELETQKQELLEKTRQVNEEISTVPKKIADFINACENQSEKFLLQISEKEASINSLKDSFISANTSRTKNDNDILKLQSDIDELLRNKLLCDETIVVLKEKIDKLKQIESERLAREAAEQEAKKEAERAAKAEAERLEKERIAREEAEKAAKIEAEKIAREEAERLAREETERKAKEEAIQLEQERIAQKRAELAAKFDAERQAREDAELLEAEKQSVSKNNDASTDESGSSVINNGSIDTKTVADKIQKQAQSSYALNFEDISPELYDKIARGSQNRKITVMKPINDSTDVNKKPSTVEETPVIKQSLVEADGKPIENKNSLDNSAVSNNDNNSTNNDASEDTTPGEKVDYIAELKKQWAAEKAHKEQWAAEQAQKKADAERRKKELLKEDVNKPNSDI